MAEVKLETLIKLLDDPDEEVYFQISDEIRNLGTYVIPKLESIWETNPNPLIQERIENIISEIQLHELCIEFDEWLDDNGQNLLTGICLVNRFQYPEYDQNDFLRSIQKIEQSIWLELAPYLTSFEQINVFNKVFYEIYGFQGIPVNENMNHIMPNRVLENKKGVALTIGIIYLLLAERLHIPLKGVNLPGRFILAYCNKENPSYFSVLNNPGNILFYVNPHKSGAIFTIDEIKEFLNKYDLPAKNEFILPCSNIQIVYLLFEYMSKAYESMRNKQKFHQSEFLMKHLQKKISENDI
ncbi:MAG: hypothetical protein EA412_05045 [Chitinophagaceae bacterium]|nr:MAG: hypothetical protein EA412_05045 [Chitinophagaceae bacterium]